MRNIVMPGARIIDTVVMTLTALERARRAGEDDRDDPQVAAEPRRADRPRQRRRRRYQPNAAAPPSVRNPSSIVMPPNR